MKPQPLRGFRDTLPAEMLAKDRLLDAVRRVFESHGYPPLGTPALEYAELLLGKYGEEGEMLLYRFADQGGREVALRYDLTVPLARVIGTHGSLAMPFRRYQIAPVWRAEKPAKGRYREFYQCDVDLVGADDPGADAEMLIVGQDVLRELGIARYRLRVNHRGVLRALTRAAGLAGEREGAFLRLLDKHEKIGPERFREQLAAEFALPAATTDRLLAAVGAAGEARPALDRLAAEIGDDPDGGPACARLAAVLDRVEAGGDLSKVVVDPSIARGLSYYTGIIYETMLDELPEYGSVMSGGRYDGLVGMFAGRDLPAVGISLGIDRLFGALEELGRSARRESPAEVLVVQFSEDLAPAAYRLAKELRARGVSTVVHPLAEKLKKQFAAADRLGIPFAAVIGESEAAAGTLQLKDLATGEQTELDVAAAAALVREARGARELGADGGPVATGGPA